MNLQTALVNLVSFANDVIIPFLLGLGFLFFLINAIRYFVAGSGESAGRENAKSLATYGVLAFVFILIFWGVVNLLAGGLSLAGGDTPVPDYIEESS